MFDVVDTLQILIRRKSTRRFDRYVILILISFYRNILINFIRDTFIFNHQFFSNLISTDYYLNNILQLILCVSSIIPIPILMKNFLLHLIAYILPFPVNFFRYDTIFTDYNSKFQYHWLLFLLCKYKTMKLNKFEFLYISRYYNCAKINIFFIEKFETKLEIH